MADLSNKALALLLLVAIGASIFSTAFLLNRLDSGGIGVTGRVTDSDTGRTNFTITSQLSIRFTNATIPFGTGYINSTGGFNACTMGTNGSPPASSLGCVGFNDTVTSHNLTIENDGNVPANVSINFSATASGFIGGGAGAIPDPSLQYKVNHTMEPGSCSTIGNGSAFVEVSGYSANSSMARICNTLNYIDATDQVEIAIWILIPQDASTGGHQVTVTALACDDNSC